jgi:hypothetical protein
MRVHGQLDGAATHTTLRWKSTRTLVPAAGSLMCQASTSAASALLLEVPLLACVFPVENRQAPAIGLFPDGPHCLHPLRPDQEQHIRDIQRLMGCMVYADRPPEATPYADLLSPCQWDEVAAEFTRQACNLMGQVGLGGRHGARDRGGGGGGGGTDECVFVL